MGTKAKGHLMSVLQPAEICVASAHRHGSLSWWNEATAAQKKCKLSPREHKEPLILRPNAPEELLQGGVRPLRCWVIKIPTRHIHSVHVVFMCLSTALLFSEWRRLILHQMPKRIHHPPHGPGWMCLFGHYSFMFKTYELKWLWERNLNILVRYCPSEVAPKLNPEIRDQQMRKKNYHDPKFFIWFDSLFFF